MTKKPASTSAAPKAASTPAAKKAVAAKSAARNTASGPADLPQEGMTDLVARHALEVNTLVAGTRHNANKAGEYGRDNAISPPQGLTVEPPSPMATGSSLSEANGSAKTGLGATPGRNATNDPLDRVRADSTGQMLTTNQGVPVADNQNSLKAGLRGPTLLEDFILREKITHFDHERIPERIVHARGSGAHGYFQAYESLTRYTRAAPFAEAGKTTPVFVRFSTVAGERGSMDTARDVRGFAVKFYTDEGNWDLVGNNIPVFFIQDAMKFPDLVHAVKPEPHHGMPQAQSAHDTFWDFISLMPESTHMMMWVMSDRAIPRSYRMMQGFGVHTFRFINDKGESHFVKFHWKPLLGTHSLVWDEALKIAGADPDFHRRDLWEAIEAGEYPEWELGVQLFTEEQAESFSFDILDATKIIPEELIPVQPVGRLVLNRNPDNFFAETEQVAFCAAHIIPGIDFTNDPLLAGRIHSYVDTQITRLGGPNFHEIPINAPIAQVHNNQRDGFHRQTINRGRVAYEPNSLAGGCPFQAGAKGFTSYPEPLTAQWSLQARAAGGAGQGQASLAEAVPEDKLRGKPEKFAEHYNQARLFYDSQTDVEKRHIIGAFRFELSKVTVPAIRQRMVASLANVSHELAEAVADGLGMKVRPKPLPRVLDNPPEPEVAASPALSLTALPGDGSIRTRKIAILVADGMEGESVSALQTVLVGQGAVARLVGVRLGEVMSVQGDAFEADASLENTPAVLFDALVLPCGEQAVEALARDGHTMEFIKDQYRHCKPILALGLSQKLLDKAGIPQTLPSGQPDAALIKAQPGEVAGVIDLFVGAIAAHRYTPRDIDPPLV